MAPHNKYQPILTEDIKLRSAKDNILMDHDYCISSKRKLDKEDCSVSEVETPCKKLKMDIILEPLTSNFDNSFCLSHCETVHNIQPLKC